MLLAAETAAPVLLLAQHWRGSRSMKKRKSVQPTQASDLYQQQQSCDQGTCACSKIHASGSEAHGTELCDMMQSTSNCTQQQYFQPPRHSLSETPVMQHESSIACYILGHIQATTPSDVVRACTQPCRTGAATQLPKQQKSVKQCCLPTHPWWSMRHAYLL
jgi:hypothetical protein